MNTKHLVIIPALLCLSLLAIVSCSKSDKAASTNTPVTPGNGISILGMSYSPATLTVARGTVVTWTNNDGTAHTATSNDGTTFSSGSIASNGTFSYTTTTAGTFNYHCTIHGIAMSGVLVVTP